MDYLMKLLEKKQNQVKNFEEQRKLTMQDVQVISNSIQVPGNDHTDPLRNLRAKVKSVNEHLQVSGSQKQTQILR